MYLSNGNESLPNCFDNPFAWKSVVTSMEGDRTNSSRSNLVRDTSLAVSQLYEYRRIMKHLLLQNIIRYNMILENLSWYNSLRQTTIEKEAQSARSGRFNTVPKRPKVDKFKHRCGPKAQKYR